MGGWFPLFSGGAGGREILNIFAYTCGFSVCAAMAGARTTSLDLSKKYLEWGKRNFTLNGLDSGTHDFIWATRTTGFGAWERSSACSTPSCSTRPRSPSRRRAAFSAPNWIMEGRQRRVAGLDA
jgi:hypothetical protein